MIRLGNFVLTDIHLTYSFMTIYINIFWLWLLVSEKWSLPKRLLLYNYDDYAHTFKRRHEYVKKKVPKHVTLKTTSPSVSWQTDMPLTKMFRVTIFTIYLTFQGKLALSRYIPTWPTIIYLNRVNINYTVILHFRFYLYSNV